MVNYLLFLLDFFIHNFMTMGVKVINLCTAIDCLAVEGIFDSLKVYLFSFKPVLCVLAGTLPNGVYAVDICTYILPSRSSPVYLNLARVK